MATWYACDRKFSKNSVKVKHWQIVNKRRKVKPWQTANQRPFCSFYPSFSMASGHHMKKSEVQPQTAGRHNQEGNNLERKVNFVTREIVQKAAASLVFFRTGMSAFVFRERFSLALGLSRRIQT
jgi:hypothetical protein